MSSWFASARGDGAQGRSRDSNVVLDIDKDGWRVVCTPRDSACQWVVQSGNIEVHGLQDGRQWSSQLDVQSIKRSMSGEVIEGVGKCEIVLVEGSLAR